MKKILKNVLSLGLFALLSSSMATAATEYSMKDKTLYNDYVSQAEQPEAKRYITGFTKGLVYGMRPMLCHLPLELTEDDYLKLAHDALREQSDDTIEMRMVFHIMRHYSCGDMEARANSIR